MVRKKGAVRFCEACGMPIENGEEVVTVAHCVESSFIHTVQAKVVHAECSEVLSDMDAEMGALDEEDFDRQQDILWGWGTEFAV